MDQGISIPSSRQIPSSFPLASLRSCLILHLLHLLVLNFRQISLPVFAFVVAVTLQIPPILPLAANTSYKLSTTWTCNINTNNNNPTHIKQRQILIHISFSSPLPLIVAWRCADRTRLPRPTASPIYPLDSAATYYRHSGQVSDWSVCRSQSVIPENEQGNLFPHENLMCLWGKSNLL